jgi:hypothetical protein
MNIKVNREVIEQLNPCKESFDHYLKYYSNFNGDIQDFLDLTEINHYDKLWVAFKIVPEPILKNFVIDCTILLGMVHLVDAIDCEQNGQIKVLKYLISEEK